MDGVPLIVEPDRDEPGCAAVLVDGTIAGRPYRFILDTGAGRTSIVADAELARLPRRGSQQSSGLVGTSTADLLILPELTVGPLSWTGLEVSSTDTGHPDLRNLLGMDAIGAYPGRFDFDRGSWQPAPTGTLPTRRPLDRGARGHILVDVEWPGVTARACWDSGAGITVVGKTFVARHPELFRSAGTSSGIDATGATVEGAAYWMAAARIGGRMFAPHRAVAYDMPAGLDRVDLVLGYPALRQAVWVFDFPARRWSVE
ncbi:hypothetical protein ACWT_5617 [Actinoplanes sp. SE50]|uniref:retropepsin-like aspartic protease n=1 Tax=unclassified Actinoplanes TaxID=2626549 RepID=UPI00023ED0ED|nr:MULTISPECIES: retropepsin-like aspartic protease [unclassified Actinoplanes]AEV86634.1 hypothetical protein ACPL_5747 [Actinoplanes sp. SE50/110]ATO85032.1 hypothetical protein ACWT_5617 [Actinoplanes sp. SE50]SLM02442.1 hypothetical protein ACSP50_5691 [Actinoplanes sp. SE50/110]